MRREKALLEKQMMEQQLNQPHEKSSHSVPTKKTTSFLDEDAEETTTSNYPISLAIISPSSPSKRIKTTAVTETTTTSKLTSSNDIKEDKAVFMMELSS